MVSLGCKKMIYWNYSVPLGWGCGILAEGSQTQQSLSFALPCGYGKGALEAEIRRS